MTTNEENIIFESSSFTVERSPNPFVSREEGGHIRIFPKNLEVSCINDLTPRQAIELIRLEMVVREALIEGMNQQGIKVVWVNLEDLGNWAFKRNERPRLHIHVFGRVFSEGKQSMPEAIYLPDRSSGFYEGFQPLTDDDMKLISNLIKEKFNDQKYNDSNWKI
jgi:diadenosine tetraphosphate (Ap4A) HIT family hydrolase